MDDISNIIEEVALAGYAEPMPINCIEKILEQMKKCICKIKIQKKTATGFFFKIPYDNEKIPVLMTNNHVINKEIINNISKLTVTFNDDKEYKYIKIDENRKIYTSTRNKYDTTIIEIKEEDKITNYLELDEDIFKETDLTNENVYIIHYPKNDRGFYASMSSGIIKEDKINYFFHLCSTYFSSSGSPILRTSNYKVIGIHRGGFPKREKDEQTGKEKTEIVNLGMKLKEPIKEYLENKNIVKKNKEVKNEIFITLKIEKDDINDKIYFLDNTNGKYNIGDIEVEHVHDCLKDLNESNTKLSINDFNQVNYKKYFIPAEEGIFHIKLKFNNSIKDCSFMFYDCSHIIDIDLSSFDTKNVTNMSYMFSGCDNITNLDLTSFDTKKVTNMSNMFSDCINLKDLNLSSFNTEKVTDMSDMFSGCDKITSIDLSSFDTKNVTNMRNMFYACKNVKKLDLSKFDTKKVTNMSDMFYYCNNIENLNLSSFKTDNVTNMSNMFYWCKNLRNLDLSSFNTGKTINMNNMFCGCKSIVNLNMSTFDIGKDINVNDMFNNCNMATIKIKKNSNDKFIDQIPSKTTIIKK